jgi:hypothetical protein
MKKEFQLTNFKRRLCLLTACMMLAGVSAFATTIRKMELPELVKTSEAIVQGRIEQVYVRWDAQRKMAFTYVSITVDDPLKGERRRSVLIRQLGGRIGALNQIVAGAPRFNVGDQVIVFLKAGNDGTFQVVGLNQGKYEIVEDVAVANVSGVSVLDAKTGRMSDGGFVSKAPLESFKSRIRGLSR